VKLLPLLRRWLRPSLSRRLLVTLVLAFCLVAVVLVASEYRAFHHAGRQQTALLKAGRYLGDALHQAADAREAQLVVRVAESYFNRARQDFATEHDRQVGALLFQLRAADGTLLYGSAALPAPPLPGSPERVLSHEVSGQPHWVVQVATPHGTLSIAEPALADATLLGWVGVDLLPSLALAFPFVLVPVWWAVRQGLRPLRRLAAQLQQRSSDDFSPITQHVKYAELWPVVEAFNAVLRRLRDALQRERAFVQDAAHELRTPMAVIAAQAHVLNAAGSAGERAHAAVAMEGAIARASHLSGQLLALAALDERRNAPAKVVDLAELVQQTLAQAAATAESRGLDLSLDAPEHLDATLDIGAFQSVLQNLVDNALNYVPRGGRVEVLLTAEGSGWCLRVADDGPGIPPEEQAHVFERFVRGRETQAGGTGLGLAIVRQAVQRLGGTVALQPGLHGRGASFEVRVPAPGLQLP
jgi:two-component system sensor histidine kinase QseC